MALFIQNAVLLYRCRWHSICSVSLVPHTVGLCEAVGKELAVSCQQRRHQKVLFGRIWGAWARRIGAGITPSEMMLLQDWFQTIMEKLFGGFCANHPDEGTHTHTHACIIWTSLAHTHWNGLEHPHIYIAYVFGSDFQCGGNTAANLHRAWRVIGFYTWMGGVWDCLTASKSHVTGPKLRRGVSLDTVRWGAP